MNTSERSASTGAVAPSNTGEHGTLSVFDLATLRKDMSQPLNLADLLHCRKVLPDESDLVQATMEQAGEYASQDVIHRLTSGREGFIGEITEADGITRIATYGWVTLHAEPLGDSGCAFEPPAGDAYLYDFATLPAFRGHGYYPALLRFIAADLAARQLRYAWIGTAPGNFVSERSITRAGFHKIADTAYYPSLHGEAPHFALLNATRLSPELLAEVQQAYITT